MGKATQLNLLYAGVCGKSGRLRFCTYHIRICAFDIFMIGYIATSADASEVSKCYSVDSENCCFYTSGSMLSLNEAREFCESKNSTLPTISDAETDSVFQRFIVDDSFNVIRNRSVWIDAYARDSNNIRWRWISGRQSGISNNLLRTRAKSHRGSAPNMARLRKNSSCVQICSNINTTLMYTVFQKSGPPDS